MIHSVLPSLRRLVAAGLAAAALAHAAQALAQTVSLLEESFRYADGPLADRPDAPWKFNGGASVAQVSGGALYLGAGDNQSGVYSRPFETPNGSIPPDALSVTYELELKIEWQPLATQRYGGVIAQLASANLDLRRARLHFRTLGSNGYKLGVSSRAKENLVWLDKELGFGKPYRVQVVYDLVKGETVLSVLGEGETSQASGTVVSKENEPSIRPRRFSVQVDDGQGPLILRLSSVRVSATR